MTNRVLLDTTGLFISKPGNDIIGLTDQNLMAFNSNFRGFRVRQEGVSQAWIHNRPTNPYTGASALQSGWSIFLPFTDTGNYVYLLYAFQLDGATDKFRWGHTEYLGGSGGIVFVAVEEWRSGDFYLRTSGAASLNYNTRLKLWYTLIETEVPMLT